VREVQPLARSRLPDRLTAAGSARLISRTQPGSLLRRPEAIAR